YNNLPAGELQALKNFNPNGSLNYVSPHGELLLWNGPVFLTQLQYTGVLPVVPPLPGGLSGTGGDADLWFNYLLPVLRSVSSEAKKDGAYSPDNLSPNDNNYLRAEAMYGAAPRGPMLREGGQTPAPGLSATKKAGAAHSAEALYNAVKDR